MIEDVTSRWIVTAVLIGITGPPLLVAMRRGAPLVRVGAITHIVMCGSMALMAWPWRQEVAVWPQVAFFACAGAWFTAQSAVIVVDGVVPARLAWVPAVHASGMFAMVWMLVAMVLAPHQHHSAGQISSAVSLSAVVLGFTMLAVTAWWTRRALRALTASRRPGHAWTSAAHAVVHAVMALMLLQMR